MQATHYTIRTHALVVLAELHLVAHQWLYFLFKLSLAIAFKEIATSISKQARRYDGTDLCAMMVPIRRYDHINESILLPDSTR